MKVSTVLRLVCIGLFACTMSALAHAQSHEHHTRVGSHGMVVYTDGVSLFAHHLPLYSAPHDVQLVYEVETQHKAKIIAHLLQQSSTAEAPAVAATVLPEVFDLNVLLTKQSLNIPAQWFTGHFERGGQPWLKDADVKFIRTVYAQPLVVTDATMAGTDISIQFEVMSGENKAELVIHRITSRPSFDAVLRVSGCSTPTERNVSSENSVMSIESILTAFVDCSMRELLYYETRDFSR